MRYEEFKLRLKKFIVFSLDDIKKIDPRFYRSRLNEWQDKKYIKKLRRGYYIFSDIDLDERKIFFIANRIYHPSYVSLESALSYYNLIPEGVYMITSVSSAKTFGLETPIGKFSYRRIKPDLMFGYRLENFNDRNCKIAEMEKAALDYLYLNPAIIKEGDFAEWRFNSREFLARANMKKFREYASKFKNKRFENRVKLFLNMIKKSNYAVS